MNYSTSINESLLKNLRDNFINTIRADERTKVKTSTLEKLFVCALGQTNSYGNLVAQARDNKLQFEPNKVDIKEFCRRETAHSIDRIGKALLALLYQLTKNEVIVTKLFHDYLLYDLVETLYKRINDSDWQWDILFSIATNDNTSIRVSYREDGYYYLHDLLFNLTWNDFDIKQHKEPLTIFFELADSDVDSERSQASALLAENAPEWFKAFTLENIAEFVTRTLMPEPISVEYMDIHAVIKSQVLKTETGAIKMFQQNGHYHECKYFVYENEIVMQYGDIHQMVDITPEQYKLLYRKVKQGELYDPVYYATLEKIYNQNRNLSQKKKSLAAWHDTTNRCLQSYKVNNYTHPSFTVDNAIENKSYFEILSRKIH